MAYDNFLIDKRVVERNIKKGLVDPQALGRVQACPLQRERALLPQGLHELEILG